MKEKHKPQPKVYFTSFLHCDDDVAWSSKNCAIIPPKTKWDSIIPHGGTAKAVCACTVKRLSGVCIPLKIPSKWWIPSQDAHLLVRHCNNLWHGKSWLSINQYYYWPGSETSTGDSHDMTSVKPECIQVSNYKNILVADCTWIILHWMSIIRTNST